MNMYICVYRVCVCVCVCVCVYVSVRVGGSPDGTDGCSRNFARAPTDVSPFPPSFRRLTKTSVISPITISLAIIRWERRAEVH